MITITKRGREEIERWAREDDSTMIEVEEAVMRDLIRAWKRWGLAVTDDEEEGYNENR